MGLGVQLRIDHVSGNTERGPFRPLRRCCSGQKEDRGEKAECTDRRFAEDSLQISSFCSCAWICTHALIALAPNCFSHCSHRAVPVAGAVPGKAGLGSRMDSLFHPGRKPCSEQVKRNIGHPPDGSPIRLLVALCLGVQQASNGRQFLHHGLSPGPVG